MTRVDYDARAGAYGKARGLALDDIARWRDALAPDLVPAPELPVVDVGSGGGHFAVALAEWFAVTVIGVEPSAGMRAVARRENPHRRVAYVAGRAEELPLEGRSCAAAWLSTIVHQVRDLHACARELERVLCAGAPVLIRSSFPGHHDGITLFRFFPAARRVAERFPSIEEVAAAFAPSGRRVERVADVAQVSAPDLRDFCNRLRTGRRSDSTLVSLTDEEFATGLERAERAAAEQLVPAPVIDKLTLLVLK